MKLLEKLRQAYAPALPLCLKELAALNAVNDFTHELPIELELNLPLLAKQRRVYFEKSAKESQRALRLGVVFSGGQAPGGHNVISGLFDGLKKLNQENSLFGFLNGPAGVLEGAFIPITLEVLKPYRNMGGFDLLGSGRTKIETQEQFAAAEKTVRELALDGLVIIGGDDSNTNAAFLAEYFLKANSKTKVIGIPKTIDGDLKNESIQMSFGFDTASKVYSEIIGNLAKDAVSAKKYYFFVKMMGRTASHLTLECALSTHPNLAIIGEEIAAQKKTLKQLVNDITDLICQRSAQNKNYGIILIPEGTLEFIPEMRTAIEELNLHLRDKSVLQYEISNCSTHDAKVKLLQTCLTPGTFHCLQLLPEKILAQLLLERDPHGNIQVSKIETESLLIDLVKQQLDERKKEGTYQGKFNPQPIFCGYEGRAAYPSNFDCSYCYALGHVAALLISFQKTGLMATVSNLKAPVEEWTIAGIPLAKMMHQEMRGGSVKWVIKKSLVDLSGPIFKKFAAEREAWMLSDDYICPGPIQFYGPREITDTVTITLKDS